jgi:alcohol dehydrogenase class IV
VDGQVWVIESFLGKIDVTNLEPSSSTHFQLLNLKCVQDLKAREMMAYAEYLAGIAFNNASLGYVHAMAHQLGGFYNLPHGVCNAILLPVVMEYNSKAVPQLFIDIAEVGLRLSSIP